MISRRISSASWGSFSAGSFFKSSGDFIFSNILRAFAFCVYARIGRGIGGCGVAVWLMCGVVLRCGLVGVRGGLFASFGVDVEILLRARAVDFADFQFRLRQPRFAGVEAAFGALVFFERFVECRRRAFEFFEQLFEFRQRRFEIGFGFVFRSHYCPSLTHARVCATIKITAWEAMGAGCLGGVVVGVFLGC